MTDKKHFTNLDSLRGIAAIMVVILHSYWSHDLYFYNFFRNGYLFSLVIKNFIKIYFKADFVIDNWGGYLEIDSFIGNCFLFFYLILVIVVANFTFIHIEQRFKHGFFKN